MGKHKNKKKHASSKTPSKHSHQASVVTTEPKSSSTKPDLLSTTPPDSQTHKKSGGAAPAAAKKLKRIFAYTQNREVSWLRFDDRVLDEAFDETVPLFERIKYCHIFQSNMDEWFMIRVGGLSDLAKFKHQPVDNKSHETPAQQLDVLFGLLPDMYRRREACLKNLENQLAAQGVERITPEMYTTSDMNAVLRYYTTTLSPILSPMIIDPRHPFPNLRNNLLYVMCSLDGEGEHGVLGMVEVPPTAQRVVWLPSAEGSIRFTLVEDVITAMLDQCFGTYVPAHSAVVRVTRNADIDPDGEGVEEEEDYRQHMKKVLKLRSRLQPVRLELQGSLDENLITLVRKELELEKRRVFRLSTPADLSYVSDIEAKLPPAHKSTLTFHPFEPQESPMVKSDVPMRPQVEDHDVLLCYPYEGMGPLLRLLHEASTDDNCISIRITLYRVANHSRLCESLAAAAENGKDVTVLMELRARFDEQNNIEWAERLGEAGCTVIYGSEGFKCHSKICQVTYHDSAGISRITCLGTGNFNEKTARLYSDFMLLTAHPGISEDGNAFFHNLSLGNLRGSYRYLGVAPVGLKPLVMRGIDREIERARAGHPAQVFLKMNSLTDRDVIDRLAEASQAGVRVIMIVRGICCMLPGVKGYTEGIEIRQIVGRLLEHARVYAFGTDTDTIYLSSADMMTRNTERRVEIAYPILDQTCRDMVIQYMDLQLADTVKARRLTNKGVWTRVPRLHSSIPINCQDILIAVAYARAYMASGLDTEVSSIFPSLAALPPSVIDVLLHRSGSTGLPTSLRAHHDENNFIRPLLTAGPADPAASPEPTNTPAAPTAIPTAHPMSGAPAPGKSQTASTPDPSATPSTTSIPSEPRPTPTAVTAHYLESTTDMQAAQPITHQLAIHRHGRIATALALFGLGFKTLFGLTKKQP